MEYLFKEYFQLVVLFRFLGCFALFSFTAIMLYMKSNPGMQQACALKRNSSNNTKLALDTGFLVKYDIAKYLAAILQQVLSGVCLL